MDQKTLSLNLKSSHLQMFFKIGVFLNFAIVTRKDLNWRYFLIKLQACRSAAFFKKRCQHRCFLVSIAKFLRTPILKNICKWLLLYSNHKVTISIGHHFLIKNMLWDCFCWEGLSIWSEYILSRNHSNTFLLLDLQKNYLMSILMMCK